MAPISLFLALCSLAGFLAIPCLAIGIVGMITGVIALWQIRRAAGEFGGRTVAWLGTSLSLVLVLGAAAFHTYDYITELPEGYLRVSFSELAKATPPTVAENGEPQIAPEVAALDGKQIYVKGYMYPTKQLQGLTEFVLVKDTGQCCFGGQPKLTDMIVVKFEDLTVNHREQQLVGVGGVFRALAPTRSAGLNAVYVIEGTHFK
ncbi:MAG: DUF3299 domain-containing protein [Planctomycetes bacterium]|nr:DUF3299 domain-containing protein [Planctomycetota bacterium]